MAKFPCPNRLPEYAQIGEIPSPFCHSFLQNCHSRCGPVCHGWWWCTGNGYGVVGVRVVGAGGDGVRGAVVHGCSGTGYRGAVVQWCSGQ